MKLTSSGELALKAMLELAKVEHQEVPGLTAGEIAARCRSSTKFLEQVLAQLRARGLVLTRRGPHGGYRLARDAAQISVGDINRAIDGPLAPAPCASVTQHRTCDWCASESDCELKQLWVQVRDAISGVMDQTSLSALASAAHQATSGADRYVI